ncbi:hypothetical protein ACBR40_19060 [Nonomuraea sp. AD125B]|uniref:hypothetical protein n=1 Tax=Nonomuraea sp. AD125B TaxID=3242897 RepID=UPI003526FBAF
MAWVWRRIVAGRGLVRVEGLAGEVGWSRKRLWSRFVAEPFLAVDHLAWPGLSLSRR